MNRQLIWLAAPLLAAFSISGCGGEASAEASVEVNADELHIANTLVPNGHKRYEPRIFPDRVVLLPTENPARAQRVNWRTHAELTSSVAEITEAKSTPGLHLTATSVSGDYVVLETENGKAHHHSVTFSDLQPDTLYAYRVQGNGTWSEWFQFRTPIESFEPYTALYFGDAQNAVLAYYSRVVRQALLTNGNAKLMLHAGDLVNSRDGIHDDEWGEWFAAKDWAAASMMQIPVTGNHEFVRDDEGVRQLMDHWPAQFSLAQNGPEGLQDSVYFTDYQGVRYIVLDSTDALQNNESARLQAQWLETVLADNPNTWTVVSHHHPMFSVSLGRDNPPLRNYWQPLYEKYGVDLVLQGHDHTYGRMAVGEQHPVYVVSVAGPKMYLVSEEAEAVMQRNAEDVQLFQTLQFDTDTLSYKSYTATGDLYDAFELVRDADGSTQVVEQLSTMPEVRCENPSPMEARRCWNGIELIYAPASATTN